MKSWLSSPKEPPSTPPVKTKSTAAGDIGVFVDVDIRVENVDSVVNTDGVVGHHLERMEEHR